MAKAESGHVDAKTEESELVAEVKDAKAEISTLKVELDNVKREKTTLEIEVSKYKEIEASKNEEISTLQNHVSTLEMEVKVIKKDLSDSQKSYRELLFKFDSEEKEGIARSTLELPLGAKTRETSSAQIAITKTTAQSTSSISYDVTSPKSPRMSSQLTIGPKRGSKSTSPSSPRMTSPASPRSAGNNSPTFGVQSKFG